MTRDKVIRIILGTRILKEDFGYRGFSRRDLPLRIIVKGTKDKSKYLVIFLVYLVPQCLSALVPF